MLLRFERTLMIAGSICAQQQQQLPDYYQPLEELLKFMLIIVTDADKLGCGGKFISCQCGTVLQQQVYIAQSDFLLQAGYTIVKACDKFTQSFKEVVL
jgi:hypothetical protein